MKYATIVADPPWQVDRLGPLSWRDGRPSGDGLQLDYPTMTVAAITALPISDLAEDDAHLFVWTIQRHLRAAFDVVDAWGFTYSCALAWCKPPHGWNPGGLFGSTLELILYARRGKPEASERVQRQWWDWPRGAHSAKPPAFLDMVESICPGPRLECFARNNRLGWDTWGNEALGHVEMPA